ncbi:MAG: DUF6290 family protein [Deferribacteraceae bacterium]|nr:DUF6290 family protein [Deferribacteraceae bacterium]
MISVRLNSEEEQLIKKYAELRNISISDLFRTAVIERIEDEYDLKAYNEAITEYKKNSIAFTHDEVVQMLEQE